MLMVPDTVSPVGRWPGTSTTPGWMSSLTCSIGREHAERLALALAQEADPGVGGVGLEVAGRSQQPQRPPGGFGGLERILVPVRHRRDALPGQLLGIEFEL